MHKTKQGHGGAVSLQKFPTDLLTKLICYSMITPCMHLVTLQANRVGASLIEEVD